MDNLLTRKLELFAPLPEDDKRFLDEVVARSFRVGPRRDIVQEGDPPEDVHLVLSGFACRSKSLSNGKRQIVAFLLPGDFCDFAGFILDAKDHTIATLSACTVVGIPRTAILDMVRRPILGQALWWASLVDESTLREWLLNLGQRDAEHRIAHLFCELHVRLQSVGLADGDAFDLPITQGEIGDSTGVSTVHVNRSLQSLRSKGLIRLSGGRLAILDVAELRAMSEFNPDYLHRNGGNRVQASADRRRGELVGAA